MAKRRRSMKIFGVGIIPLIVLIAIGVYFSNAIKGMISKVVPKKQEGQ